MTIETFEKAKKLREEIGRLSSIRNALKNKDAELNIVDWTRVTIKSGSNIHEEMVSMFDSMINSMESEFEKLGEI